MASWKPLYRWMVFAVLTVVLFLLVGLLVASKNRDFRDWMISERVNEQQITDLLGGADVVDVLRRANRVEASLLELPETNVPREAVNYQPRTAVPVDQAVARSVANILTTKHRQIPFPKSCLPAYGVRLRYILGDRLVDVYFCFECAILEITLNGTSVGGMNFDLIWTEIMHDVRQVFPDDSGLAELESKHE